MHLLGRVLKGKLLLTTSHFPLFMAQNLHMTLLQGQSNKTEALWVLDDLVEQSSLPILVFLPTSQPTCERQINFSLFLHHCLLESFWYKQLYINPYSAFNHLIYHFPFLVQ